MQFFKIYRLSLYEMPLYKEAFSTFNFNPYYFEFLYCHTSNHL